MFVDLTVIAKMGPSTKYKLYSKLHKLLTIVFLLMLPYAARLIDQVKNWPQLTFIFPFKNDSTGIPFELFDIL